MNDYKSQIKSAVDSIRQDMRILRMYGLQGVGYIDVPFDVSKYGENTIALNHLFIALQQAG